MPRIKDKAERLNLSQEHLKAIDLMDSLLLPSVFFAENIKAESGLSDIEIVQLLDVVVKMKNMENVVDRDIQQSLKSVSYIMRPFVSVADTQTKKGMKISLKPMTMPFLIQQVLFCLAYMGLTKNPEQLKPVRQNRVLEILEKIYGVKVSDNFFSRMPQTPDGYARMTKHIQPQTLFKYNGQKDKHLGAAIRHLVYQAGKYYKFIDLFGGSGAATLAIPRGTHAKVDYVYNEQNKHLVGLFKVIKENASALAAELDKLKEALKGGEDFPDIDFDQEMTTFYFRSSTPHLSEEDNIYKNRNVTGFDWEDIKGFVERIKEDLLSYPNGELTGDMTYGQFAEQFPDDSSKYEEFFNSKRDLFDLATKMFSFEQLYGMYAGIKISFSEYRMRMFQLRFYKYYAYFTNLLEKTSGDDLDVRRALAVLFIHSLLTQNNVGISAINRMIYCGQWYTVQEADCEWEHFLYPTKYKEKEQKDIILDLGKVFQKTEIERNDCIDCIEKYCSHNGKLPIESTTIFYSDSPYSGTTDYDDKSGGVQEFTPEKMKELIRKLKDSCDKFIFSCRACLTGRNATAKNVDLVRNVFEVFFNVYKDTGQSLWVLTIIDKDNKKLKNKKNPDFFSDVVHNSLEAEVMICNFEIWDFVDKKYPNVVFKVYTYKDFIIKLLKKIP